MDFKAPLIDFIAVELLDGTRIDVNENLLADGTVDSLGMMRLVAFLEELYGINVPIDDFVIENFRSVAAIDAYLQRVGAQPVREAGGS